MCREKPIEQCVTYISQSQQCELVFDTSSSSDTELCGSQPVTESKIISQQPPHDSHASSISDHQSIKISGESAGVSFTVQSQADNDSK